MKKLLLSLVAVSALAFTTQAQTEKGNFLVGGNVELNTTKTHGASKTDFDFAVIPSVGYFISDNFAIGTGVGYSYAKSYTKDASFKSQAVVVSPFARAYKGVSDEFKFFGQLSVPMSFGNNKKGDVEGHNMYKQNQVQQIGVALSPGFAFFPNKKVGIEFSVKGISYNDDRLENAAGDKVGGSKNFSVGGDFFSPRIGVQFYL